MKLNISPKVEKYLAENGIIDERKIWSYAWLKALIKVDGKLGKGFGRVIVCIREEELFFYRTEINSTELELIYTCTLEEMQDICVKKTFLGTHRALCFSRQEEKF